MNSDLNNSPMQYDVKLTGYWTSDTIPQFKNFDPGIYTVIGGDEWGAMVVLHYTVSE
jgi:hypothetical protein